MLPTDELLSESNAASQGTTLDQVQAPRTNLVQRLLVARTDDVSIQALRYIVVGAVATVADMLALYILTSILHVMYQISAACGFVFGLTVNYLLSIRWVFASRMMSSRSMEISAFAIIGIAGLGLTEAIMYVSVERLHTHYMFAKAAAVVIVFAWNFIMRRTLLFAGARDNGR
jgi:putative flippase GtrA